MDDLKKLSQTEKGDLMDKVKTQVLVANMQELIQTMTDKCFAKCISKPGAALDSGENKCLALCMDRYMDSHNLVTRTYAGRIQRESAMR